MGRASTVDRRPVLDAIFYVALTGCQWRVLPATYPKLEHRAPAASAVVA